MKYARNIHTVNISLCGNIYDSPLLKMSSQTVTGESTNAIMPLHGMKTIISIVENDKPAMMFFVLSYNETENYYILEWTYNTASSIGMCTERDRYIRIKFNEVVCCVAAYQKVTMHYIYNNILFEQDISVFTDHMHNTLSDLIFLKNGIVGVSLSKEHFEQTPTEQEQTHDANS